MFDVICAACDKKWKIKVVSSDFMLGVKREITETADEFSVTLTMTAYVDGMVKAFEDDLPKLEKRKRPSGRVAMLRPQA